MPAITDGNRRWWILVGASTGLFVLMLDSTVVALALPSIRRELGATTAELQWVQNVYLLAMAALVVTAGRAGDVFGRKLVFQAGMVLFGAGSVIAATAGGAGQLVAGRAVQGIGAAALLALSLAIVTLAFGDDERSRALGIWAAVSSLALALGPLVGGIVIELASWRWIFWLDVPLVALALAVMAAAAPETRDASSPHRIDLPGLATLTLGLSATVLALVQGKQWGWGSPATLAVLGSGLVLLAGFVVVERRVAAPIVDFDVFRNRSYLGASAAAFALVGSFWFVMFVLPQYLELVLGYSTFASGLLVLPVTAPMVVVSAFASRLIARFGARALMTTGMACAVAGVLVLTLVDASSGYLLVLPGLALFGFALGLVYTPMSAAAMAAMPPEKAGIASGVLAMTRTLAGTLLLAVGGALFQHVEVERTADGESFDAAFSGALAASAWLLAAVLAAGTVLTALWTEATPHPHEPDHRRFHL